MEESIPIDYDKIEMETEAAWLLETADGAHWFPKSLCPLEENEDGSVYCLAPEWMAQNKGLI